MAEGSKTEKATPKRRRDERKKGNVFKSQDVIVVVSLLGCFYGLQYLLPFIYDIVKTCFVQSFTNIADVTRLSNEDTIILQNFMMWDIVKGAFPLLLLSAFLAVIATGVQTRFLFSGESLQPKLSRLNPISGIKKLFSFKNVIELIKNLFKITLLIFLLVRFMLDRTTEMASLMSMDVMNSIRYILVESLELVKEIALWFVVIASFDFLYQWWDYERQIKMSKQELKEEYKQTEGNPEIKSKIKEMQRARAQSRMMQAVPTADVIIRNPTHFAVALKYDKDKNGAPIVVAKGQDELALRIVKIGEEHKVHVIENQPLARALFASTHIGREIPPEYYGLVAEILVYVYKLNNKKI